MRAVLLMALLATLACPLARADDAPSPAPAEQSVSADDRAAVQDVIRRQMDAFRRDDAAAAFAFASPSIRSQFGSDPDVFMEMVRRGYAPVYHPRTTSFGRTEREAGRLVQHVLVTGPDGGGREALYFMEQQPDGSWRIAGCVLTDTGDVGA